MSSEFERQWALKWAEGVLLGFARDRIELNRAMGMLRRAEKLGVKENELLLIIQTIEDSPVHLPSMTQQEKKSKLQRIREVLKKGSKRKGE